MPEFERQHGLDLGPVGLRESQVYEIARRAGVSAWKVRAHVDGRYVGAWAARRINRAAREMGL